MKIPCATAVFALAFLAALAMGPRAAQAQSCKPDGAPCGTNQACCGKACVNGAPPGSKPFATCCTPTTCTKQGANCGTIPNGTCPKILGCGSCTSPNSCGGGGTPNVCGCTPITTCPAGDDCGSVPDDCGGTLNCGTCTAPNTCGGGGTANVCGCTPRRCADVGASCGTISDGCGGTISCGNPQARTCTSDVDCPSTETCYLRAASYGYAAATCVPKELNGRGCWTYWDCFSGCCCYEASCYPSGFERGSCDTFESCTLLTDHDLGWCPGSSCGQDQDCPGFSTQFCTGGICRRKEQDGNACSFSAGCTSRCCCSSTSLCQEPASCSGGCNP
jgi:hypothetical protein